MEKLHWIAFASLLTTTPALADDAATLKLFKANCATCHGLDGKGATTAGKKAGVKDWSDGKTLNAMSDADIEKQLREGAKGKDGKQIMPAFKKLTAEQVAALVKYVRTFQKK